MGRYSSVQKIKMGDVDVRVVSALPTGGQAGELVYLSNTSGKGVYVHNGTTWEAVGGSGGTGGGTGGTATTADRLTTPRIISISGDANGSGVFDGSSNMDIAIDIPLATQSIPGLMTPADKTALAQVVDPSGNLTVATLGNTAGIALAPTGTAGTATTAARSDHVHPLPSVATATDNGLLSSADKQKLDGLPIFNNMVATNAPSDLGVAANVGSSNRFAKEDHVHKLPDIVTVSTDGLMSAQDKLDLENLKNNSGSNISLATNAPLDLGNTANVGTSTKAAREDHVHKLPNVVTTTTDGLMLSADKVKLDNLNIPSAGTSIPLIDNGTGDVGTSANFAREDHVHPQPIIPLATITDDGLLSSSDKQKLDNLSSTTILPSSTTPLVNTISGDIGTSLDYARGDHQHPLNVGIATPMDLALTAVVGTSDKFAREDHVHKLPNVVTTTTNGLMLSADKVKLDSLSTTPMIPLSEKGATNGVATLINGKVNPAELPALTTSDVFVFASQAEMTAASYPGATTTATIGDVAVRTDLSKSFILKATPQTDINNWQELLAPTAPIQSVNGYTNSNVVLTKADIQLGNVDNTSDLAKPISTATQAALDLKQDLIGYTPLNKDGDTATNLILKSPSIEQLPTLNAATTGATLSVDYSQGSIVKITASAGVTSFTINITNTISSKVNTIILQCIDFGGKTITWSNNVKWAGGTAPAFSNKPTTGSAMDVVMILKDNSNSFFGFLSGKGFVV